VYRDTAPVTTTVTTTTPAPRPAVPASRPAPPATIQVSDYDISYDLDLQAVIAVFADSRNLEEFEWRLNDYNLGISNLDLNRDGHIDYLRVMEAYDRDARLIIIQAVLGYNVFQDVAFITVERDRRSVTYFQIMGSPYLYGVNYIIEPVFYRTPAIYAWLWRPGYTGWASPYYWGYYPPQYRPRPTVHTHVYVTNIYNYYGTSNNRYNYVNARYNQQQFDRMHSGLGRNDYARTNPNQSFERRNTGVRNARDMQTNTRETPGTTRPATPTTRPAGNNHITRPTQNTRPAQGTARPQGSTARPAQGSPSTRETPAGETPATTRPGTNATTPREGTTRDSRSTREPATTTRSSTTTTPANTGRTERDTRTNTRNGSSSTTTRLR
jgi:hypothetical protein